MNRFPQFSHPTLLVLLLGVLFFPSCEPDDSWVIEPPITNGETATSGTDPGSNTAPAAFATMLADINALRGEGCRCGNQNMPPVGLLSWNADIAEAAVQHSNDMAQMRELNHVGSNGGSAGDRLHDVGYLWQTYGENIASGYDSANSVLEAWINSPGHCRNLMGANFMEMGAAQKEQYWTQVFARPQ
jgi:uncharacterized protein YkwD